MPAARRTDRLVRFRRTPGTQCVAHLRRVRLEDWILEEPSLLDVILAGKQSRNARHGIAQPTFEGVHLLGAGMSARDQLGGSGGATVVQRHDIRLSGDRALGG
jgi:hypothetical protein